MESEIARIIRKYDLDMFRIDQNTTIEEGGNHIQSGFVEDSTWRYVENLYAMFDRLRKQFPKVIFQNCAGGGGRLDYGILRRFDTTELSDWMRGPRGIKVLNGMTWLLPPEILLRTFGTEVPDLAGDGDVESQMAMMQMSLPIFRGISPSPADFNPILRDKIRTDVELYKKELRPIMRGSRVFHHTPMLDYFVQTPWLVLEYATPDAHKAMATLFRTSNIEDPVYPLHTARAGYFAQLQSYIQEPRRDGRNVRAELMQEGISVRLETAGTSEMLLFSDDTGREGQNKYMTDSRKLFDLTGRKALITGASVGFGEAISLAFADYGCDVAASDLDLPATQKVVDEIKEKGKKVGCAHDRHLKARADHRHG